MKRIDTEFAVSWNQNPGCAHVQASLTYDCSTQGLTSACHFFLTSKKLLWL